MRKPAALLANSPELPRSPEGDPVFAEPWQADAFAMTVSLYEKGVFSWSEWAEVLSQELYRPGRRADAADYFDCWVAALSRLVTELSITSKADLDQLSQSWQRAAAATPHGKPIRLDNDPLR
ncbi:nitrile hydratase accessory protein [Pararhizobium gei]|uniref:nitrile hydratase accessory protein n=1 Tax=Pararhizobium gei TaxID=1395951 RepID=UPI0023DC8618|nr:nitrile hydratase accessory protein [Rhizobium gei]